MLPGDLASRWDGARPGCSRGRVLLPGTASRGRAFLAIIFFGGKRKCSTCYNSPRFRRAHGSAPALPVLGGIKKKRGEAADKPLSAPRPLPTRARSPPAAVRTFLSRPRNRARKMLLPISSPTPRTAPGCCGAGAGAEPGAGARCPVPVPSYLAGHWPVCTPRLASAGGCSPPPAVSCKERRAVGAAGRVGGWGSAPW